jgi:hypothetical protein
MVKLARPKKDTIGRRKRLAGIIEFIEFQG